MSKKIGAVLTGGDFQGLGVLRSLARKGVPILLLDSQYCIGRYSRYKKRFVKSPHPSETEVYLDFLIDLSKKENIKGWIIFPNSDEAVFVLSRYKSVLEKFFRIPPPSWNIVKYVYIKKNTYKIAQEHNIPIPKTYYPQNIEELVELDLQFPLVIKPSIRDRFYNKVKIKAFRVNDKKELISTYRKVCSVINPSEVLIQEFISGGPYHLYSFCPFFKNGQVLVSIMARRSRQHPMDFGHATTFAELVHIEPIQKIAERFLRLIDYYGIAEIEFMHDPKSGEYKLLEVNPRIWGWHTLAIAAGVDFPYIVYKDMIGEPMEYQPPLNNMKWVRLITDIPTVFFEVIKRKMKISGYISSMKGKKEFAVFAPQDLLPFFAEIAMIPYLWVKRGF